MGIDLQVLASNFRERDGQILPTASLRFDRDQRLLSQFSRQAVPSLVHALPEGTTVGLYADRGLIFVEQDQYKQPLTFTTSIDLRKLRVPDDLVPWNRAILAFLLALVPDCKIVLYWC